MFSAHSRAGKSPLFSKRTSQSSGSSARTTMNAVDSSRTASLPPACPIPSEEHLHLVVLDDHLVAAQVDVRVGEASPCRRVVLEAVPRADDDLAVVDPLETPVVLGPGDEGTQRRLALAQGARLVRADVGEAVELAADVEDPDLTP